MTRPRIAALVPMRDRSERVPGKNFRLFAGRPLFYRILEALSACSAIDEIVIDTDSETIARFTALDFPAVRVLERPTHLRGGEIPMNDVLLHDVEQVEAELFLQTHSTNPLLSARTIGTAIDRLSAALPTHDSLFSVTRLQTRLWDASGRPLNHDPGVLLRTQDLPPVYEENSCLYLFSAEQLRRRRNRIGERPLLLEIDPEEAWDIDEEIDFTIAEFLWSRRGSTA